MRTTNFSMPRWSWNHLGSHSHENELSFFFSQQVKHYIDKLNGYKDTIFSEVGVPNNHPKHNKSNTENKNKKGGLLSQKLDSNPIPQGDTALNRF